jgi:flagellar basal body-associated protein FliL
MADENTKAGAGKKDLSTVLGLAFAGVNLVVLAGGSFLVFKSTIGHETESTTEIEAQRELAAFEEKLLNGPVVFSFEPFNTNLGGVPRRLIRMEVSLEMLDEQGFEEVVELGPQARDSIMKILNGKSFGEVETVQGKLHLKNQIITQLNSFLDKGVVQNVYFSDFVIQ